jgi:hypothetical protein
MYYLDFLRDAHHRLAPRAYLEIGIRHGDSLALARCRAVGIDPAFAVSAELNGDVGLFRTTSDEFFSRPDPLSTTGGVPFDLAFIDGLHLFEFALRDFIFAERHASTRGMIILDDVLPRSVDEAARERHTVAWTGDVFRVLEVLSRYRPDLVVVPINTTPTGLLTVFGLDPSSTVLADHFDQILADFRQPDPQPVPEEILDRSSMVTPERFLQAGVFELLGSLPAGASAAEVGPAISEVTVRSLGPGFVRPFV